MSNASNGLASALSSLIGVSCQRSLATNSLKLLFDFRDQAKGRAYIWIDPPWRLTNGNRFVTGSYDWPQWDGIEDPEVNRPLWEAWCALFDPLNSAVLVAASVGRDFPDLGLRFDSGHEIHTFGNDRDGVWWYYRDRLNGECFEARASGVVHEVGEPVEG